MIAFATPLLTRIPVPATLIIANLTETLEAWMISRILMHTGDEIMK